MKPFGDRLVDAIRAKNSRVVVGLDPRIENLPEEFQHGIRKDVERATAAVVRWAERIIDVIAPHAVAIKPQIAFYELLGPWGVAAYYAVCKGARKKGLIVIGDVKRGDVPDTAKAYATAHLESFDCDAITINPYLGSDAVAPFLEAARKNDAGLFVLVKTSNPGSADVQDLRLADGRPLYEAIAERVAGWGREMTGKSGYSSVGAVVGATHPQQAEALRKILPNAFFLVPGYGAQGATAADVKVCFNADKLGAVVSASRSIIFAHEKAKGVEWTKAAEDAVVRMKADINGALEG